MTRLALIATLLLAAPLALAAPVPKEVKKQTKLDGTWEVVEYHTNGVKANGSVFSKWVIEGETLQIQRTDAAALAVTSSYSLKKPEGGAANALDYVITYPNAAREQRVNPGLFEVDGDTFKFCWTTSGERPAECKPARGNVMYVFKRVEVGK